MEIKDTGERRYFSSGAVRDITDGKGRCDLLPLDVIGEVTGDKIFDYINGYIRTGNKMFLIEVIKIFSESHYKNLSNAMLEVAKHYEAGCIKYGERNWEKGIPLHCFIDSAIRHYFKWLRGDKDEPHDRAFLWNMLGAIWTQHYRPLYCDLPFENSDTNVNPTSLIFKSMNKQHDEGEIK